MNKLPRYLGLVDEDEVVRIDPLDDEFSEEWVRESSEPDIRGFGVARLRESGEWQVSVALAEFVRDDPLETEMRQGIQRSIERVPGVESVSEHDRETWGVTGNPSGEVLAQAVAEVLDELADRARTYMTGLGF